MKFPESWLREHVRTDASREELARRLTLSGLEVEEITQIGGELEGVVVAEILACEPHPDADRLQVCRVATGSGEVQIVCGAPNARPGLKAPLAMVGAELPGGLKIKPAKLRGIESSGMLCSAKELLIDADASGLLELSADAPVGEALARHLGLPDASFELKLTPNLAHCFSIRGVAFDVAASFGSTVQPFEIKPVAPSTQARVAIALDAGADCPRYCGRVIEGIEAGAATPAWIADRLRRSGVRPVSLLVDVTQYVMLELGQPMHAFDRDALEGPVGVRRARPGETLKLLDEREVTLDPHYLLVTDGDRPVALAGVMGGWDSRVTQATRNVFLESAHFAPDAIIGRARKLGMHTDASHRFERGVDPELPRRALERATALILAAAGGQAGPVVEATADEHLRAPQAVRLRRGRLARVLGITVDEAEVERILRALGMQVDATPDGWVVVPPSSRFDIAIEEDLVEEVARIHGYDRIPTSLPTGEIRVAAPGEGMVEEAAVRRQLAGRDYLEAINYAFVDPRWLADWGMEHGTVALANPLSSELAVMRPSLLPGLVATVRRNRARQAGRVRLFELGRSFSAASDAQAPVETRRVAAVACGPAVAEQWGEADREVDFFDLKGDLESLFALTATSALRFERADVEWLHPGRSARVLRDGRAVGWIGHLHPALAARLDLDGETVVFEVELDAVQSRAVARATPPSRYPSVRQDLAFVVPEAVSWQAMRDSLEQALGPLLREVVLFDRYVGKGLEPGTKSLAMGLILQDVSRTLAESDVEQARAAAITALTADHGAIIRG
ncbi:phenylalanine--tRNA ligase subunit beta [Alkalisalibacterium limincola]|uniref:Phenylalanine--tRNA ligase beta subunit n=1 Tax=Alkalisalibacterium limincola TaxID=2699169 RepID=A0A5C8KUD1_9GAMM|nr:phenylalanine--tRNA ligase subunit beta [Alkalisalibacterium limincola]TXK65116.1 phenylalanine--tRNA ligase subunit beta [Alkalisalibacterium limincola]